MAVGHEGIRAGAAGFLVKDIDPTDLIWAVRVGAGGEALMSRFTRHRHDQRMPLAMKVVYSRCPGGRWFPPAHVVSTSFSLDPARSRERPRQPDAGPMT